MAVLLGYAMRKRGTNVASHMLRQFQQAAAALGKSSAILYLDLAAAFDSVVREIAMCGRLQGAALESNFRHLDLDEGIVEAIALYASGGGDILQRAEIEPATADLSKMVHECSCLET